MIYTVLGAVNITTHFHPPSSPHQILFHPKDKVQKGKKINVMYQASVVRSMMDNTVVLSQACYQHPHLPAGRLKLVVLDHVLHRAYFAEEC